MTDLIVILIIIPLILLLLVLLVRASPTKFCATLAERITRVKITRVKGSKWFDVRIRRAGASLRDQRRLGRDYPAGIARADQGEEEASLIPPCPGREAGVVFACRSAPYESAWCGPSNPCATSLHGGRRRIRD